MIIKNQGLLRSMSGPGHCEACLRWCNQRAPHHVFRRSLGGANRVDIPENIVALGGAFDCGCHARADNREPGFGVYNMLDLVRFRLKDGRTVEELEDLLDRIIRAPKNSDLALLRAGVMT